MRNYRGKRNVLMDRHGFSLIEIIITVAFMAIVAVPMYSYFSNAMKHNKQSELRQGADVAAQNVLEDLKSASYSLSSAKGMLDAEPESTSVPSSKWSFPTAMQMPATGQPFTLQKNVTVNNSVFTVQAEVTPRNGFTNANHNSIAYMKNDVPSMNSKTDVMASETEVMISEPALRFFSLWNHKPSNIQSYHDVEKYIKRKIHITLDPVMDSGGNANRDKVHIIVACDYTFDNGGALPSGIDGHSTFTKEIVNNEYRTKTMKNIFIFYQPDPSATKESGEKPSSDDVIIENNIMANASFDANQIKLYIVAQNTVPATETPDTNGTERQRASGYTLKIVANGTSSISPAIKGIYTNLNTAASEGIDTSGAQDLSGCIKRNVSGYSMMEQDSSCRVADIKVSVYKAYSTDAKDLYTMVEGTKVQEN